MHAITINIDEALLLSGLGKTKFYELLKSGEIKGKKLGARTLILRSDLEEFLNNLEAYPIKGGISQ
ncbi:MAG: DNA-binding protein [Micavibrio aeruginosavorus]|uniref:DNA-binding protein n=1 Tax=Micavibrio aeruginosavorus TaxID=349221 RepID=A0A2W5HED5_9BACT|nr:MAG: DNA-binding protein [Micavibrio aeruginosavorus]